MPSSALFLGRVGVDGEESSNFSVRNRCAYCGVQLIGVCYTIGYKDAKKSDRGCYQFLSFNNMTHENYAINERERERES